MVYPYYAEICALSQLGKKPGYGADIFSGFGGHAVLYLNRVCRRQDLRPIPSSRCATSKGRRPAPTVSASASMPITATPTGWPSKGGISFSRATFKDGEPLTRDAPIGGCSAKAQSKRIYDDVTFHDEVYDGMPAGFHAPELPI